MQGSSIAARSAQDLLLGLVGSERANGIGACGSSGPPPTFFIQPEPMGAQIVTKKKPLSLTLYSNSKLASSITISGVLVTESGIADFKQSVEIAVPAGVGRSVRVDLSAKQMGLNGGTHRRAGWLRIKTSSVSEDGEPGYTDSFPTLYFHALDGDHEWLVYDEETLLSDFEAGALNGGRETMERSGEPSDGYPDSFDDVLYPPLIEIDPPDPWDSAEDDLMRDPLGSTSGDALAGHADAMRAISINFCFNIHTVWTDAEHASEDFWTNNHITVPARGMFAKITADGINNWEYSDELKWSGSDRGCTGYIPGLWNGYYKIRLYTSGKVAGNDIQVMNAANGHRAVYDFEDVYVGTNGPPVRKTFLFPSGHRGNVYAAMAFGWSRHNGGISGTETRVFVDSEDDSSNATVMTSGNYPGAGRIRITPTAASKKMTIAHELGHIVGAFATGAGPTYKGNLSLGSVCSVTGAGGPSRCRSNSGNSHTLTSREYAGCAASEGWANFYAADVYNTHHEDDCAVPVYGRDVDCESGFLWHPNRYMEKKCDTFSQSANLNGMGVELDWLRAYWDVHTNGGGHVGHAAIHSWLDDAVWEKCNVYSVLSDSADSLGGTLDDNWDHADGYNGIDWTATNACYSQ
ncbi:MAG: hypothetical protein V3V08_04375 [Nannocystaceae bacterium]